MMLMALNEQFAPELGEFNKLLQKFYTDQLYK